MSELGNIAKKLSFDQQQFLLHGRYPPRVSANGKRGPGPSNPLPGLVELGLALPWHEQTERNFRTELGSRLVSYVKQRIERGYVQPWS